MSVRVMLVDDHPVVRAGVRAVVEAHPDLTVVAEAADGAEAIGVLEAGEPAVDVVLMDLQMGAGMDGVTATRAVRERWPGVQVLILTTFDTEADILAAVNAGAAGYLLKDADPDEPPAQVPAPAEAVDVLGEVGAVEAAHADVDNPGGHGGAVVVGGQGRLSQ